MDASVFDQAIMDRATAIFLRYLSGSQALAVSDPRLDAARDRDLLRMHWSISNTVERLATYVLENRHKVQSILSTVVRHEDGMLRGRLDARATVRARLTTGLATAVVGHEPIRSYDSGPNQVLGWVLMEAWSLAARFGAISIDGTGYVERVHRARRQLDQCRRLNSIAQIAGEGILNRRPNASALAAAQRSRRTLYRMAEEAYTSLLAVEAGNPDALKTLLQDSLLGPLESWRRFELAVGLAAGEALAAVQGKPLLLNLMIGDNRRHIAKTGRFVVLWQSASEYFRKPPLEPSEEIEAHILKAHGLPLGGDRPDLVIVDLLKSDVVGIIEVKYLTAEDASDRVRSAIYQLVRYARGYRSLDNIGGLLNNCLAMMSGGVGSPWVSTESGVPMVMEYDTDDRADLKAWASRLLN